MNKNTIIITLFYIINETCFAATPNILSSQNQTTTTLETNSICSNTQTLAKSLHVQRFNLENEYKEYFLNSMNINIYPNSHLNLVSAIRISGECAGHLDDIHSTIFHFDTNITLTLNEEGAFVQNTKNYQPQFIIRNNDINSGMIPHHFEKAIEVGWGYGDTDHMTNFIGILEQDGKSIFIPYNITPPGEFHIHDALLEFNNKIISIRFIPHIDTPSGTIQVLLQNEENPILIKFMWIYRELFLLDPNWN